MKKIAYAYNKLEEYLLVASIVFTVTIVFYQVIMRFVFNNSPDWTEEVARYVFIWQIWMGASAGLKDGQHIKLEMLSDALIKRNKLISKNVIELIMLIGWIAIAVFLTFGGISYLQQLDARHALSAGLRIPLVFVYAALPVSCGISSLRIAHLIFLESKKLLKGGAV